MRKRLNQAMLIGVKSTPDRDAYRQAKVAIERLGFKAPKPMHFPVYEARDVDRSKPLSDFHVVLDDQPNTLGHRQAYLPLTISDR